MSRPDFCGLPTSVESSRGKEAAHAMRISLLGSAMASVVSFCPCDVPFYSEGETGPTQTKKSLRELRDVLSIMKEMDDGEEGETGPTQTKKSLRELRDVLSIMKEMDDGEEDCAAHPSELSPTIMPDTTGGESALSCSLSSPWGDMVRIFTYLIGREAAFADNLKWMACANKGFFTQISTLADVQENVMEYLHVLSRPKVIDQEHDVVWTEAYIDSTELSQELLRGLDSQGDPLPHYLSLLTDPFAGSTSSPGPVTGECSMIQSPDSSSPRPDPVFRCQATSGVDLHRHNLLLTLDSDTSRVTLQAGRGKEHPLSTSISQLTDDQGLVLMTTVAMPVFSKQNETDSEYLIVPYWFILVLASLDLTQGNGI
ncbi:Voltage-dependent calcium channel subunit alpha-2/delta-3 [Tupaia chinensis]|uniref:Voltage-dependent calcium channel subunit alpha-2/delta-3 n=1 Tax=Tupaia chinensis TaxID=246437 RepID=L9L6Q4_TUPCH|nr:Voltage-dependent calcium channel subunit alpha-2/delta-3 [Tupaia chinensis]